MTDRCNSCHGNCLYNSRNCSGKTRVGALGYLRNTASACAGSGSYFHTCEKSYAQADMPCMTGCSGERIFYTGPCASCPCGGCGNCGCNGCGGCNGCNGCNGCSGACGCLCENAAPYSSACFTAAMSGYCPAGGALTFAPDGDCGCFTVCPTGIRIDRSGRYMAIYTFSVSACENAASELRLELNGKALDSSRAYLSPAVQTASRSAVGQAVFCAQAGDILSLNTSVALNMPECNPRFPGYSVIIVKIN